MRIKWVLGWFVVFVLFVAAVFWWAAQSFIICWDGIEVDEPLLMDLCGITEEEYFSLDFKYADCPEAEQAVYMIGGCETDWPSVFPVVAGLAFAFLLISVVLYGILRLFRRKNEAE
jgi:hypothetical protein